MVDCDRDDCLPQNPICTGNGLMVYILNKSIWSNYLSSFLVIKTIFRWNWINVRNFAWQNIIYNCYRRIAIIAIMVYSKSRTRNPFPLNILSPLSLSLHKLIIMTCLMYLNSLISLVALLVVCWKCTQWTSWLHEYSAHFVAFLIHVKPESCVMLPANKFAYLKQKQVTFRKYMLVYIYFKWDFIYNSIIIEI